MYANDAHCLVVYAVHFEFKLYTLLLFDQSMELVSRQFDNSIDHGD